MIILQRFYMSMTSKDQDKCGSKSMDRKSEIPSLLLISGDILNPMQVIGEITILVMFGITIIRMSCIKSCQGCISFQNVSFMPIGSHTQIKFAQKRDMPSIYLKVAYQKIPLN